ncbi:MAG: hypothetical protein KBT29_11390 [Prevotellaceae bacterium]|nr:hypothetical protein [Candidatus Minthosoma caballi]
MKRILICLSLLMMWTWMFAQEKTYSMKMKNQDIESVIRTIRSATGYEFVYQKNVVKERRVSQLLLMTKLLTKSLTKCLLMSV